MRIRSLLTLSAAIAVGVAALVIAGLLLVTHQAQRDLDEQAESQDVARHTANMLSLTNEFAVFGGERATDQWRSRHQQLVALLERTELRHQPPSPQLAELRRNVEDLPALFETLVQIGPAPATPLARRRRELLLERMLTETQEVVESRYRWALAIGERQRRDQRLYTVMVLAAPGALLVVLIALCVLVGRRVLAPLARLQDAVQRMQAGDLAVRCASDAPDELGDAARAVDTMALALRASQQRLQTITDHLPAFVGHVDAEERYTFVNAWFARDGAADPASFIGRTLREVRGDDVYRKVAPWIRRVLAGETVNFETTRELNGRPVHRQSTYVPDLDDTGRVRGFYAMTFDVTARKEAELAVAHSEQQLRLLADSLPALVARIDTEGRYGFVNAQVGAMFGLDAQAMLGKTMREVVGKRLWPEIEPHVARALRGETAVFESIGSVRGKPSCYQSTYVPDIDEAGRVHGFYAMTFDISARKEAELAVARSEQQLRLLADSLPALVARVDADERYTFVNAHIGRVFGGDPAAMLGRTMRETRGEAIYRDIAPHVAQALGGETASFESQGAVGDRLYYYQSTYVPDIDEAGRVLGFYAMTFDLTARKEAELRLAASEQRLKDITDNVPALVAYIDRDHHYAFANGKYREWMGIDPAAMVGRTVSEAVGEEFHALIRPRVDAALRGERVRWERRAERDGREHFYLAEYIPDVGPDGEVRGCYALTIDISERRAAEQAVTKSEQRLLDLANSLPATVGYFDMEQRCQYANDTALRSQGLERADLAGLTLRATLGEANYAQHEPYVREALKGRRSRLEGRIAYQGREAFFQAHLIPDRVEGGAQRGFYLMSFDITALKEAQAKQAVVERRLRAITDNLPVLISYLDRDERTTFINATIKDWLGVEPSAILGRPLAEVADPAHYAQRREHIARALAGERVEFSVESVTRGATRYLQNVYIPDIQSDGRVAGIYTLSTDVTALKQIETQLNLLARVDALTGLPNRRNFEERLVEATARSSRNHAPLALMFLDVDHFKSINDSLGHAGGDAVLKEFGQRLKASVRVTDVAARLAGDEFVILLEGIDAPAEAEVVAKKVVAAIRKPFIVGGNALRVTTSIGVAYSRHPEPDSGLMDLADAALYEAKGAGRDTFRLRRMDDKAVLGA